MQRHYFPTYESSFDDEIIRESLLEHVGCLPIIAVSLHPDHHELYLESDELLTNEALFVKSIDKMAPDIFDFLCGEAYWIERMVAQVGWTQSEAISNIRANKRPYMEWAESLTEVHDALFRKFTTCREFS